MKMSSFKTKVFSLIILLDLCYSLPITKESNIIDEAYKAALVVYKTARPKEDIPQVVIKRNIEEYVKTIEKSGKLGVDLLVFPEHGLTTDECTGTYYPTVYKTYTNTTKFPDTTIFCDEKEIDENFRKLSCAAMAHNMFVVVPMIEKFAPSESNISYYFTTVVFNNKGSVSQISRRSYLMDNEQKVYKNGDKGITVFNGPKEQKMALLTGLDFMYYKKEELPSNATLILISSSKHAEVTSLYAGFARINQNTVIGSTLPDLGINAVYTDKNFISNKRDGLIIQDIPLTILPQRRKRENDNASPGIYKKSQFNVDDIPPNCLHEVNDSQHKCKIIVQSKGQEDRGSNFKKVTCFNSKTFWNQSEIIEACALLVTKPNEVSIESVSVSTTYDKESLIQAIPISSDSNLLPSNEYQHNKNANGAITMETTGLESEIKLATFGIILVNRPNNSKKFERIKEHIKSELPPPSPSPWVYNNIEDQQPKNSNDEKSSSHILCPSTRFFYLFLCLPVLMNARSWIA